MPSDQNPYPMPDHTEEAPPPETTVEPVAEAPPDKLSADIPEPPPAPPDAAEHSILDVCEHMLVGFQQIAANQPALAGLTAHVQRGFQMIGSLRDRLEGKTEPAPEPPLQ